MIAHFGYDAPSTTHGADMQRDIIGLPDAVYLRDCFQHDPEVGHLYWKRRPNHHFARPAIAEAHQSRCLGKRADHIHPSGYRRVRISIDGVPVSLLAHRVIWKMVTGEDPAPDLTIDHINRCRDDNRFCNLRVVSQAVNNHNRENIRNPDSVGVYETRGGKFRAQIRYPGHTKYLGIFDDFQSAQNAFRSARHERESMKRGA